ncbi:MAG TPA: hypothetical protein PLS78_02620 [bacterium]|nr:hypothetical protein [bacterium]
MYHIYASGNEKGAIFRNNDDCLIFIQTLTESVRQHGLVVHVYYFIPTAAILLYERLGKICQELIPFGERYC